MPAAGDYEQEHPSDIKYVYIPYVMSHGCRAGLGTVNLLVARTFVQSSAAALPTHMRVSMSASSRNGTCANPRPSRARIPLG
jgi:hypothetical protein